MSVTYRNTVAVFGSGNVSPPIPSGTAANDILVLLVNTNAGGTISAPSGYSEAASSPQATTTTYGNGVKLGVFWKRAGAGELAPTVSDPSTADGAIAALVAFSGCVTSGDPWDVTGGTAYSQEVQTTSTTSYLIDTTTEYNAWTHTANVTGSGGAVSHDTTTTDADGSGANGQIRHRATGRTVTCTNTSVLSVTPTSLGVPADAGIVGYSVTYSWRCSEYTTGASSSGQVSATAVGGNTSAGGTGSFTATTSYADASRTNVQGSNALNPSSAFNVTLTSTLATGNSSSAAVSLLFDNVRIAFDYVPARSPFSYPALTTTQTNTMVVLVAGSALETNAYFSAFSSPVNANLTSLTERADIASGVSGELSYGGLWVATGFSAAAQALGTSTVATSNPAHPISLWTGALLGTDSVGSATYSHSGWGIPLNSA